MKETTPADVLELANTVVAWSGYILAAVGAVFLFVYIAPKRIAKETRAYLESPEDILHNLEIRAQLACGDAGLGGAAQHTWGM